MRVRVPQGHETCQPFHEGGSNDNDHLNRNHGRQRPMNLRACRTAHPDIINNETKEMRQKMETWEYFRDRVETLLTYLPERTLNAGIDAVTTIIVYGMALPYTAKDYKHALAAWLQRTPRHVARPHRRVQVEPDWRKPCQDSQTRSQRTHAPHPRRLRRPRGILIPVRHKRDANRKRTQRRSNDNDER